MEFMASLPADYYDWAIVDPPYFSGPNKLGYYREKGKRSKIGVKSGDYKDLNHWDIPRYPYYEQLKRVSKNQIIWGINYFEFAGEVPGRIIWDKCNGNSSFSDCEIASCSTIDSVRKFTYMWSGMLQGKSIQEGHISQGNKSLNEKRIHPMQKPVILYDWILNKFSEKGQRILDTHGGSGSICIACDKAEINIDWVEIDKNPFNDFLKRFELYKEQLVFI